MKKKLIKLSMFVLLSLTTSTIFAQSGVVATTMSVSDMEKKLTSSKQWLSYDPKATTDAAAKNQSTYFFLATHKVNVTVNGKMTVSDWKLTSTAANTETSAVASTTIKIGTQNYTISFGSDKTHPEFMMLTGVKPTPATTTYFYSKLPTR